jgi:hypothetical protein
MRYGHLLYLVDFPARIVKKPSRENPISGKTYHGVAQLKSHRDT